MTKRVVYKRRAGARFPGDVQKIGARIKQVERCGGDVPAGIVEDARDPSSPCHEAFDWDDSLWAGYGMARVRSGKVRSGRVRRGWFRWGKVGLGAAWHGAAR